MWVSFNGVKMASGFGVEGVLNLRFMARDLRIWVKLVSFGVKKVLGVCMLERHSWKVSWI